MVDNSYFITEENIGMLKLAKEANSILVIFHSITLTFDLSTKIWQDKLHRIF